MSREPIKLLENALSYGQHIIKCYRAYALDVIAAILAYYGLCHLMSPTGLSVYAPAILYIS